MRPDDLDEFTGGRRETLEAVSALHDLGLAGQPSTAGCDLSPFGTRTAARIKQSLLSGSRRADAVQRALLQWLDGRSTAGPSSIDEFLAVPEAVDAGQPMILLEIHRAAELLLERGFIRVVDVAERAFVRPEITADGRAALLAEVMITDYGRPHATTITNDYSARVSFGDHAQVGGVISGGAHNQQSNLQVIGPEQQPDLAVRVAALVKLLDDLPDDVDATAVTNALEALSSEVSQPQPSRPVVQDLLLKATGAAVSVLGSAAGQQLLAGLAQVAGSLG